MSWRSVRRAAGQSPAVLLRSRCQRARLTRALQGDSKITDGSVVITIRHGAGTSGVSRHALAELISRRSTDYLRLPRDGLLFSGMMVVTRQSKSREKAILCQFCIPSPARQAPMPARPWMETVKTPVSPAFWECQDLSRTRATRGENGTRWHSSWWSA